VSQLWDRLELRDRSMILCLEAVVRSVRMDGTALVSDVAKRYVDARLSSESAPEGVNFFEHAPLLAQDLQREILHDVLPELAKAELVRLPATESLTAESAITISNAWLRLALLEAGLIQLDLTVDAAPPAIEASTQRTVAGLPAEVLHDDWSQLWFAVQRYQWTTLAVVSASVSEGAMGTATMLAAAARQYLEGAVELVDASNLVPSAVDHIIASMNGAAARGSQMIIALDCPLRNPASIPIARHADVSILAVRLGETSLDTTRRSIDVVGQQHFVGSVALRTARAERRER
jgi:hypothetical protein